MKSYSNIFFLPFALIICIALFSGFAGSSENSTVEKLLIERVNILHGVYTFQITADEAEKLLYEIETQPLLASDIRDLRTFSATDMDMVLDMEIIAIEKVTDLYGRKSFRGEVLWHMRGYGGDYIQSVDYSIVMKKSTPNYKLSELLAISPF